MRITRAINTWLKCYLTPSYSSSNFHWRYFVFSLLIISNRYLFWKKLCFSSKNIKYFGTWISYFGIQCFSDQNFTQNCFRNSQLPHSYQAIWPITHYLLVIYRFLAKHMTGVLTQLLTNELILARRVWRG